MIELVYTAEKAFVYNLDDWKKLRDDYRIIGEFIGATQYVPALPLALLPEEAILIINLGIAKLVKPSFDPKPDYYDKLKQDVLQHQKNLYLEERKKQIGHYKDKIVKGKRAKGDGRPEAEIVEEELQKPVNIDETTLLWPILLKSPYAKQVELPTEVILKHTSDIRRKVYEDLWKRGYFLTSGEKFGGDFLAYLGDPIQYHAIYIIKCLEDCKKPIHSSEIVAFGRLGSSVKKKAILATLNPEISYVTLNWVDV